MTYVKTLLIVILFFSAIISEGQVIPTKKGRVLPSKIAKIGYSGDFMPFQEDNYYSLHLDLENSTQNYFVTNEIGVGFMRNGSDLYYAKFDYKFYPISAILNNFRYQGLYLSIGPGIYYEDLADSKERFGLGIFSTAGLQFLLNNRISLAFEVEMNFVSNLNSQPKYGPEKSDSPRHFSNSLKIGYLFNKKYKKR